VHRAALDDCQLHLDNLRSRASALAAGVAPLSAITVAASLLDSAAWAAAAARSAARAVGTGSSDPLSAHARPNLLEESDTLEPNSHLWSKRSFGQLAIGQLETSLQGPIITSSPGRKTVAETGITVRDLEEGIAGLARSSPSTPALGNCYERMDSAVLSSHASHERTLHSESSCRDLVKGSDSADSGDERGSYERGWNSRRVSGLGLGTRASDSKVVGSQQQEQLRPDGQGRQQEGVWQWKGRRAVELEADSGAWSGSRAIRPSPSRSGLDGVKELEGDSS
jgi:hypothetical protein